MIDSVKAARNLDAALTTAVRARRPLAGRPGRAVRRPARALVRRRPGAAGRGRHRPGVQRRPVRAADPRHARPGLPGDGAVRPAARSSPPSTRPPAGPAGPAALRRSCTPAASTRSSTAYAPADRRGNCWSAARWPGPVLAKLAHYDNPAQVGAQRADPDRAGHRGRGRAVRHHRRAGRPAAARTDQPVEFVAVRGATHDGAVFATTRTGRQLDRGPIRLTSRPDTPGTDGVPRATPRAGRRRNNQRCDFPKGHHMIRVRHLDRFRRAPTRYATDATAPNGRAWPARGPIGLINRRGRGYASPCCSVPGSPPARDQRTCNSSRLPKRTR